LIFFCKKYKKFKTGQKCGIKLDENPQFISLLSNAEIMENRLFPQKPILDEKIIDPKLASLRSNPTNYWTFALHAAHEGNWKKNFDFFLNFLNFFF